MGGTIKDKEMSEAEKTAADKAAAVTEATKVVIPIDALQENLLLLEAAVGNGDQAGMKRVLRKNTYIRRHLLLDDFSAVAQVWLPKGTADALDTVIDAAARVAPLKVGADDDSMDTSDDSPAEDKGSSEEKSSKQRLEYSKMERHAVCLPETEAYFRLFVVSALLARGMVTQAKASVEALLIKANSVDARPTLGILLARAYHYRAHVAELEGGAAALHDLRDELLAAHRTSCLRLNEFLQVTLVNLVLRSYVECNLVEQAAKFAAKASFPDNVSNNQQVRYLYYMGRIHAIQLDYSLAFAELMQALRKSPQHNCALGFRTAVVKLVAIVQLLMGDTPERSYFSEPSLEVALRPYLSLVKAVRNGSLAEYDEVCKSQAAVFAKDNVSTLVVRLRNSVIRTGLRRINASYSRISFKDVAARLALDSPESAELACAKAIRDGVIDATINHEQRQLTSSDVRDIYSTIEPQQAFHKRIQFCLTMHNDAVKAMRYPPDAHKAKHNIADDDEENKKTDEEIAEEELEDDE